MIFISQFEINNQLIDNATRHKELSVALCNLHERLLALLLSVCNSSEHSISIKQEVLSHAALIIESSTHKILLELINAPDLWALLNASLCEIGGANSSICVILFELFIVAVSRQECLKKAIIFFAELKNFRKS